MENNEVATVAVKKCNVRALEENLATINKLFSVRLISVRCPDGTEAGPSGQSCSTAQYRLEPEDDRRLDSSTAHKVQTFIENLSVGKEVEGGGEDSSYDSDFDCEEGPSLAQHPDVSRTASDTLEAEFAEYVSADEGYTVKLEFALKLGYTEKHVQAALQKLGPNPAQNELLAELIKIGAHAQPLGNDASPDWCDEEEAQPEIVEDMILRPVVIDGSNVAMSHGNKEVFSCRGIKICVDWFRSRGHKEITVFVPKWRKESSRPDNPISDQEILYELERERLLVFTPSRLVGGKRFICYDDRYILRLAVENGGIVVSNDNYRDLAQESPEFRKVVEERILMYSFVNDRFMPPDDPLGRSGPKLDNFLMIRTEPSPPCPYGKKCTYGSKCKFQHPERGALPHKTVTERLQEHAQRQLQGRGGECSPGKQLKGKSLSLPLQTSDKENKQVKKIPLSRTKSNVVGGSGCSSSFDHGYDGGGESQFRNHQGTYHGGHNLHKKLQRQLTLNPSCDPRLYRLQRGVVRQYSYDSYTQQPPPSMSSGHSSVTRISSAPPLPSPQVHSLGNSGSLCSASDPQLHAWGLPTILPPPPMTSAEEARRKLHYHLASIFPEEQVRAAMQLYPNETNPQKICAAILALFPSKP